jgi:hypothetical protein
VKKTFAFSFLFVFTLISFKQVTLFATYLMNQKSITEKFCVNKDKPIMQCKGKCHLKDALVQSESKDNTPINLEQNFLIQVFFEDIEVMLKRFMNLSNNFLNFDDNFIASFSNQVFRPPTLSSYLLGTFFY